MTGGKSKEWTYTSWNLKLNINVQATQLRIFSSISSHKHWRPRENGEKERASKLTVDKPSPPKEEKLDISQGIWNALSYYYKLPFTYCIYQLEVSASVQITQVYRKTFMYSRCLVYMQIEKDERWREIQERGDIGDIYKYTCIYLWLIHVNVWQKPT